MNWFRRLTHQPAIMATARALGLARLLKHAYYGIVSDPEGVFRTKLGGVSVSFYASNPSEWRMLEGLEAGKQECFIGILARELKPGDVFYDVGSNIGEYAVLAGKLVHPGGMVVAFEPEPSSFECLQTNLTLNELRNVRTYPVALGACAHRGTLVVGGSRHTHSRLWESSDDIRVEGSERLVDVVTGDELSEAEHLKSPTVVKVDVEGHEYAVLRGLQHSLSRVDCRLLCCEIHPTLLPPGIAVENVLQQIQALDFRKQDHVARGSQIHVIAYR